MRPKLHEYGLTPRAPEAIDSSMLKDYMDCPSMFYLRHVLGLRRKIRSAGDIAKFDWGTCWHGLQEEFWKTGSQTDAIKWLNLNFPEGIRPDTDKHKRSKERMFKIFFEYVETFGKSIEEDFETIRTEQFFDIFNEEFGIRWCGRLDVWRVRRRNGRIVPWDYKTTSAMSDSFFEMHEHGFQIPGYVWAAKHLTSEPIEEIVLDVLYTLTASHQFFRRTFRYTPQALNEWATNVKRVLDQMYYLLEHHLDEPRRG
jgi:hypothetical protein